ncbi:MAG: hypothetical protein D6719_06270, partial [Candidatus Dadabacteria bacterium]
LQFDKIELTLLLLDATYSKNNGDSLSPAEIQQLRKHDFNIIKKQSMPKRFWGWMNPTSVINSLTGRTW